MNKYYIYVYLDSRKPGKFIYNELGLSFLFEPIYVGKGCGNRYKLHLYKLKKEKTNLFGNVLKKIVSDGLKPIFFKLYENSNQEFAFKKEILFVKSIGRKDLNNGSLLNHSDGGMGGVGGNVKRVISEEGLIKIRESRIKNPGSLGKKWNEETKLKMKNAALGRKFSEEHKQNLRISALRRKERGFVNYNKGKKLTEEHKQALRNSKKIKI